MSKASSVAASVTQLSISGKEFHCLGQSTENVDEGHMNSDVQTVER